MSSGYRSRTVEGYPCLAVHARVTALLAVLSAVYSEAGTLLRSRSRAGRVIAGPPPTPTDTYVRRTISIVNAALGYIPGIRLSARASQIHCLQIHCIQPLLTGVMYIQPHLGWHQWHRLLAAVPFSARRSHPRIRRTASKNPQQRLNTATGRGEVLGQCKYIQWPHTGPRYADLYRIRRVPNPNLRLGFGI